ncbi:hypothetical protein SAE02_33940 [Skermanella aerolata]|uniref:Uncharacterized protein n=1 Tax=Skermanella aerolata TaxID=393310 RepID=A0A512DS38_9PROT|nr:hypothetical protein N826_12655 [Skermanella aerolata KACC 11604]GEO39246.1 hypothetical protein SAE02_33940 [Skermanella aerolata]
MQLPERQELDQLSEEKIKMVYALADKMPDGQLRGQLKDQIRHRLKKIRPLRRLTASRLFCLPFESLLSNDALRVRTFGSIPRNCVGPLWSLVKEELPDHGAIDRIDASNQMLMPQPCPMMEHRQLLASFADAVSRIRSNLSSDRGMPARLAAMHRDLPDVMEEVHAIYQMRDEILTAKRQIMASEQLIGIGDDYARSVMALARQASAGRGDQRWYKLFFLVLLMDEDLADHSGALIEALAEKSARGAGASIASEVCELMVAREGEALKAGFAAALTTPADLNAAADQVRASAESLGVMRLASPHLNRQIGESIDQMEGRIHEFLGGQFAKAASASVASFTGGPGESLPTMDEIKALGQTILAVAKVQAAIHHIYDPPADLKELAKTAIESVGARLDRIAAARVAGTMRQKQDALAVAVQVARSIEPISNEETVLEMLEDCAVQLGFAESSDPAQFFLKIIHAMNTTHE